MRQLLIAVLLGLAVLPAAANDSMAELKTGGLAYVRTDAVSMVREDLFVSQKQIRVDYVFRNHTGQAVTSIIAFPMPDVTGNPYEGQPIPDPVSANFLDFSVRVDGKAITPTLSQRAIAFGIDVTEALKAHDIPLLPSYEATHDLLLKLPASVVADWTERGIVVDDVYDAGQGVQHDPSAVWTLQSRFWWKMTFPAGQDVHVSHSYTPSLGGAAGIFFLYEGKRTSEYAAYAERYCIDASFEAAVKRRLVQSGDGASLFEQNISYILGTGRNWAGPIGTFHLTVDKGAVENLVSFCGRGVTKTGPTRFELTYKDFVPERDLDVLFLVAVP